MMENDTPALLEPGETAAILASPDLRSADLDMSRYMPELAGFDITEAEKAELLETLWSIMRSFVELGFQVNICEQIFGPDDECAAGAGDAVSSPPPVILMEGPAGTPEKDGAS